MKRRDGHDGPWLGTSPDNRKRTTAEIDEVVGEKKGFIAILVVTSTCSRLTDCTAGWFSSRVNGCVGHLGSLWFVHAVDEEDDGIWEKHENEQLGDDGKGVIGYRPVPGSCTAASTCP